MNNLKHVRIYPSAAGSVIVVVPSLKELPEAKLLTNDTTLQLSETDGNVQFTCALQSIPGLTVIFVGQFRIVGEISSFKIMDCIHLDANIRSNGSIAVQYESMIKLLHKDNWIILNL